MQRTPRPRSVARLVLVLVVLCLAPGLAVATPPPPPAAYYGTVTVNGTPAPAGVTVVARIDGEVRGTITTGQRGTYGGPGAFAAKLIVHGSTADEGAPVTFSVAGEPATTTVSWQSGDIRRVDLTVTGDTTPPPDDPGNTGDDPPDAPNSGTNPATTPGGTPDASTGGGDSAANQSVGRAAQVSVARSNATLAVSVVNATPNETVSIDLAAAGTGSSGVALEALNITTHSGGAFTLNVSHSSDPPADAPADVPPNAVGFISVEHSIPDTQIQAVDFTFRVATTTLTARGIDPGAVALYRYHDGTWTALETTQVGETPTHYRYRAVSPGFSVFAIGQRAAPADLAVTDTTLSAVEVRPGAVVRVTAAITNRGDIEGTTTVRLRIDGVQRMAKTITVPGGVTRQLGFEYVFDTPGVYTVRVENTSAGTLTVLTPDTATPTTDAATTTAESRPPADDNSPPQSSAPPSPTGWVGAGLVALGLVIALVVLWRRRRGRGGGPELL